MLFAIPNKFLLKFKGAFREKSATCNFLSSSSFPLKSSGGDYINKIYEDSASEIKL